MKALLKKILKWCFLGYVAIAALVGSCVMAWPFVLIIYNGTMAPAPFPVYLSNGFIYDRDDSSKYSYKVLMNGQKQEVVAADVKDVMWHENTVYGFRLGPARDPYYYICTYGEDCSDTQHLKDVELKEILRQRGLPEYNSRVAKTYKALLWEQSKTDIGKHGG